MNNNPPEEPTDHASIAGEVRTEASRRSRLGLVLKRVVQGCFLVLAVPMLLAHAIGGRIWGRNRSLLLASEWLAGVPGTFGVYLRQAFYHRTLSGCGRDVYFGWLCTFSMEEANVGDEVYIGRRCSIGYGWIGDRVMLADGVQILSGGREHQLAEFGLDHRDQPQVYRRVTIGSGAWIGTNAVVLADVGEGAVIGAGAVVVKPIPPHSVAVGVPARVVRTLS